MNTLFIIPARGGSKGLPGKNIKPLNDVPLIFYSIDVAREFTNDSNICISTDDTKIKNLVEKGRNLKVPFVRPSELASDSAGTYEVLIHALDFYEMQMKKNYDAIVLLQPTSPFRTKKDVENALHLFNPSQHDMVVSVVETKANPYFSLFEENDSGFLEQSKKSNYTRRQDCPKVYEYNGAVYVINVNSLKKMKINEFVRIQKSLMDKENSLDIDTPFDWEIAEYFAKKRNHA